MLARVVVTIATVLVLGLLALSIGWPGLDSRLAPPPIAPATVTTVMTARPGVDQAAGDTPAAKALRDRAGRHGDPGPLGPARRGRRAAGPDVGRETLFQDVDALATTPELPVALPDEAAALLRQRPRVERARAGEKATTPRTAPWSADQLLADPTHMNDEYVTLQASPVTGDLFAVFAAHDLGGTTRDIHIARSVDQGASWTVVRMPTFSLDESMPDLAIDAAGYLYVVWVRADGVLIRARSAGPEDIVNWAYVQAFQVGEPVAVPSIAVSGSGDFARVFIACSWYTINWNWWQHEYTLLWLYSTNGGQTVAYDYLEPDGHQDLWPVVAISGSVVYMVNGEQDPYTGRIRILAAADALSGTFVDYIDLTQGSPMSSGFPSIAADGQKVHIAYQLDWDAGPGGIDGDVMYFFSWDGLASAYGPYAIMATPSESVGPQVFTRGGLVGCVWLEAPAGGDEFHLAARQAPFDGHPEYWGAVEQVTDLPMVVPQYRAAAAAVSGPLAGDATVGPLVAVWMDRRDFNLQGFNIYTSRRPLWPNLAPFTPEGWQSPLVLSMQPGQREDGPLGAGYPAYASLAVANVGLAAAVGPVAVELRRGSQVLGAWTVPGGLPAGAFATAEDHSLELAAGLHTLSVHVDPEGSIPESDETDNVLVKDVFVLSGDPQLALSPTALYLEAEPEDAPLRLRRHEPQGPVLEPRLAGALVSAGAHDLLRVVITPVERPDPQDLARFSRRAAQAVLTEAAGRFAAQVSVRLDAGDRFRLRPLWLSGELVGELTPAGIEAAVSHPAVARIWLDDRRSETFAAPGGARDQWQTSVPWHLQMLGAPEAWAQGLDGNGILVGHTDSGVAWDHPDLVGRLWDGLPDYPHHGYDFIDDDLDPYDEGTGSFWHGTHTAGLIVGAQHGVAPGARVLVTRCVPGYYQDLVAALQFCLDHGCHLISTSAGWTQPSDALRSANRTNAEIMLAMGVPWFVAAGNGDNQGGHLPAPFDISSPGDAPEPVHGGGGQAAVLAVGAIAQNRQLWSSSSLGPTAWNVADVPAHADYPHPPGLVKPDLVAPGVDVTSTIGGGGHATYSGTSMATPLVAGAVAILSQASPAITPQDLATVLAATSEDLGPVGRDNQYGAGLVDLSAALAELPASTATSVWARNLGAVPLLIDDITTAADWLQLTPRSATVAPGDSLRVAVTWDAGDLAAGLHHATVVFSSNDPQGPVELPVTLAVGQSVGVADPPPPATGLLAVHPNPFNPRATLRFAVPASGPIELQLFDARGRLVRTLVHGERSAGWHTTSWDGRDAHGRACASGVYLVRLAGRSGVWTARLVMVR